MNNAPLPAPALLTDDALATAAGGFRIIVDPLPGCPGGWPPATHPPGSRAPDPRVPPGGSIP
jgi:hypothetical protein